MNGSHDIFFRKSDLPMTKKQLKALKHRYDKFDEKLVQKIVAKHIGKKPEYVARVNAFSLSHVIYDCRLGEKQFIFRANIGLFDEPEEYFYVEQWIVDQLEKFGLPSFNIYAIDTSRNDYAFDYQLMEKVPGVSLDVESNSAYYVDLLRQLGSLVAKLHRFKVKGFGYFDPEKARTQKKGVGNYKSWEKYFFTALNENLCLLAKAKKISRREEEKIKSLFEKHRSTIQHNDPRVLHGDLGGQNIFINDKKISGIVDWEDCRAGDPVFDIVFWATYHPKSEWEYFLDGYKSIRRLPNGLKEKWPLYFLRIAISKAVCRLRFDIWNQNTVNRIKWSLKQLS